MEERVAETAAEREVEVMEVPHHHTTSQNNTTISVLSETSQNYAPPHDIDTRQSNTTTSLRHHTIELSPFKF